MHDAGPLKRRFMRHANVPSHLGTLPDPSGRAVGVGRCGDTIEVMLRVEGDRICEIRHLPHGCAYTVACGSAVCELALHATLEQALEILPQDVEKALGGLPEDHLHCARLAVNTLGEAVADCYRRAARPAASSPHEESSTHADL